MYPLNPKSKRIMKPNKPSKFRRIILVNWLDLPYAQIDLDDNVTIFEGGNGSGKSTVLLAALVTLMPDKKQLRSRTVTVEKNVEEAIYHRLQADEPISYAALEIQLADEIILAGVHITKQKESNGISLDVFIIRRWSDRENVQDFFRFTEGEKEWTCNLNELKQRCGEWGMEFHAHPTLIAYFREMYEVGVIPLAMATDSERSQYAHMLETSMAGGMSSALVDRLKNYLLPEYEKLPDASRLMHDNLRSCIGTQNELKSANEQYIRIATLFRDLNYYVTALGTRIKREKDAANEKLKLTETNLETTLKSLDQLETEKGKLLEKKQKHDSDKRDALSSLQLSLDEKRTEEQRLKSDTDKLTITRNELNARVQPLRGSRDELEKAVSGLQDLQMEIPADPTGKNIETRIKTETDRLQEELIQLKEVLRTSETEQTALKNHQGASSELVNLAEKLNGTPIVRRYADLKDLNEAAQLEAKLGPLVSGLIVKDAEKAASQIAKLDIGWDEIWLTTSEDPANEIRSKKMGAFQKVDFDKSFRMTRIPDPPVLGEAARKKRLQELELRIKKTKTESAELENIVVQLEELKRHAHRIADEWADCSLSWLKSEVASIEKQAKLLNSKIDGIAKKAEALAREITSTASQFQAVADTFNEPDRVINAAISQNDIAIGINTPLRDRLKKEREDGIANYTARRDEFAITNSGISVAEKRLAEQWLNWREDLLTFTNLGLSPEDAGAWTLLKRAKANQIPRSLTRINRRTLNAWERRHSKVVVDSPSKMLAEAEITVDELTRLRLPPNSKLLLQNGNIIDCKNLIETFGEIAIPERGWDEINRIDAPDSRVIISIENKGAFVDFPAVSQTTLLFLPGDNTSALELVTLRLRHQSLIHFGDLDSDGIQIYESLVTQGFAVRHFVPTYAEEYLITHARPCKTPWPQRDYSSFPPIISTLASKSLWLEQEALVLDHRFDAELAAVVQRNSKEV